MTHPIFGLIGKLADGAVESVVIGSCLTKQVVNWLVNINRIRILGFTEQHYPEAVRQLDGGDKRVLRAFLDPESLSNTYSLLVGEGAFNTGSEYRISRTDLLRLLQDTMGSEATFDNSFVERIGEQPEKFDDEHCAFVEIADALLDENIKKVVVLAHSQGTIITGDVLNLLYLSIDECFFDRTNMNDEDLAEFLTVSNGTVKSAQLRRARAELNKAGKRVLEKIELYTFANAASRMCYANPEKKAPHIESYANEHDIVTRLGPSAPRLREYLNGGQPTPTGQVAHAQRYVD